MSTPPENRLDEVIDQSTGDAARPAGGVVTPEERAAAALHAALAPGERMPDGVRARLSSLAESLASHSAPPVAAQRARTGVWWIAAAAVVVVSASAVMWYRGVEARERELVAAMQQVAEMRSKIEGNDRLLAEARARVDALSREAGEAGRKQTELAARLAEATSRLGERESMLAAVRDKEQELSKELDQARLTIAKYEEPADPAVLAQNRKKLLEVPDTVRMAWAPFDLPDAPAEQRAVQGDVAWNDRMQTGYLRFVGLKVNDPKTEQYQVWVIDERGMEQKVSGGIFNATADGEVIVPIDPGIPVGRVALFAITVEKPGGTWVPDLKRRIVVAPRG